MMALETVVYPQDTFSYVCRDFCSYAGGPPWGTYDYAFQFEEQKAFLGLIENQTHDQKWEPSPDESSINHQLPGGGPLYPPLELEPTPTPPPPPPPTTGRRKRRRTRSTKNKEEIENQRMTHIAVERNRRKQMNEYLAVLRSLMPSSYVQRGDQASIIGGAINFVKELEQQLQFIKVHKEQTDTSPFADFFSFPQYSTRATTQSKNNNSPHDSSIAHAQWPAGDIEVTMVDTHANLKILSQKRPRQLLKMVAGFQSLRLTILHLNVTTSDQMVLYSLSIKVVEEGCQLNTVDEIAAAVNQILLSIQEEAVFS
ncbi:transcription factor bHLH96 [Cucumis melo var. makuwa]|uniref:Transcription factor bHLH96 n=1 Tax=Cucumis melo var. makuwa TaxID=1194695 RepID=A0A5A7VFL9_CUCMM|nr:transcription factor bHLH96 [Cucumis melo var. makuwa]